VAQRVFVDDFLAVVHDDHLPKVLFGVLQVARQLVEVTLVERGEVVDDAEEVVGQLEDKLLQEELGRLLLHHRQLIGHPDG